jgi:hypothetical protein
MKLTLQIEVASADEMQQLAAHLSAFAAAEPKPEPKPEPEPEPEPEPKPEPTPKVKAKAKAKAEPAQDPLDRALIEADLRAIMSRIGPERMREAKEAAGIAVRLQHAEGDDLAAYRALADRLAQEGSDA